MQDRGWRVSVQPSGEVVDSSDGHRVGLMLSRSTSGVDLLLSGVVPLRRVREPLFDLLARTMEMLMAQANATGVSLEVALDDGVPKSLFVDGEKIAWGIASLVGSALRRMANVPPEDKRIRVGAALAADRRHVVLSVVDNGPAIPRDRLEAMLQRDPATRRGGGLSLVLLNDVVVAHGGHLEVESSADAQHHGTTVRVALPIEAPAA
jgi:signal transduction histidine kinase